MRLTVLFEPRPWIKRWACSRSRTVAPVLHYFRVLRGVLRHHWPINKESPSTCNKVNNFFFWPLCVSLKRDTVFSSCTAILVHRKESWCVCAQVLQLQPSLRTLNQFWKNLYATLPHLSMNDVVNPNTGLYHDQSLFNQIQIVKPLLVGLCVMLLFLGWQFFFFFKSIELLEKKIRMTIFFLSQKFW